MKTYRCVRCKQDLQLERFNKRKSGSPYSHCITCQREYSREHYRKNKKKHNKKRVKRKRNERNMMRDMINEIKDVPCMDCGEKHPSWAMDFDHRDPKLKKFTIGNAITLAVSRVALIDEMEKCDIVCALCHRYRTHGKRRGVA